MAFPRSRVVRMLLLAVGLLAMASLGAGVMFYVTFLRDLPGLRGVRDYRLPVSSRLLDRNGVLIATYFDQRRRLTPFDSIPKHVVDA